MFNRAKWNIDKKIDNWKRFERTDNSGVMGGNIRAYS
jgi:hypothetical protein